MNNNQKMNDLEIVNYYLQGLNTVEIAKKYNSYNTSIRRVLLRNNVLLRSNHEVKSFLKEKKFENPLTKDEFYWLGLLISDGCISNGALSLSLKEEDKYMLENFKNYLGNGIKLNKYFHKKHNHYEYYVKVKNRSLNKNLQNLANFINKSFEARLYIEINWDIMRGLLDADGSVGCYYHRNCKICRTRIILTTISVDLLNQVKNFYDLYNIKYSISTSKKNSLNVISVNHQDMCLKMYDYLYKDANLYLIRKKEKFKSLLQRFNR